VIAATLDDFSRWARSSGLEIVLFFSGAYLVTRALWWFGGRATARIDADSRALDAIVSSEEAKHRHVLVEAATWSVVTLLWIVVAVLVFVNARALLFRLEDKDVVS
jgi:small conductance mechanosensitive channel